MFSAVARIYISVIRGTPLLVQLFVIFYGLPSIGMTISPWPSAIIAFSLNVGGYAAEVIRAAILSVPKGQWEAGHTIGMSRRQSLVRIILPQAARVSVPPLSNTFISLVKDTSLASLILVTELFRAGAAGGRLQPGIHAAVPGGGRDLLGHLPGPRRRTVRPGEEIGPLCRPLSSRPDPRPRTPARTRLLTVRGLRKAFGQHDVLKSIDLDVRRGEVVTLIGPSGSGKTTVLRCLNGLEVPDAGIAEFAGQLTVDFSAPVAKKQVLAMRDRSAMVFQHYNLFPHKTVLENIIEGPVQVQKRPKAEAIQEARELLARVGLAGKENSYPFELSGGQQQRVGIVRALALRPQLLLFDEPTSALDPELVGEVLTVIKELADEGWTMVVVTHELAFARQVADEVIFMDGGVVVERGHPDTVLRDPREERTRQFVDRLLNPF